MMTDRDRILAPLHVRISRVRQWPKSTENKALEELLCAVEQEIVTEMDKLEKEVKPGVLHASPKQEEP